MCVWVSEWMWEWDYEQVGEWMSVYEWKVNFKVNVVKQ